MRVFFKSTRQVTAVFALGLMLSVAGCQPGLGWPAGSSAGQDETLRTFVEDLARQALAAFLL